MKPETTAIHIPNKRRDGAVAPSIHLSTTFDHGPANERPFGYEYIRGGNPNVDDLEERLTAIEGGIGAVAFSSGMAAVSAILNALSSGSRVLIHKDVYFDLRTLALLKLPYSNYTAEFLDFNDEVAFADALDGDVSLIWFESPSNPLLELVDIKRVCGSAASVGAKTLIDGTFATPALQRPLELGADYVLHSLTKYLGGHSDVQGGALVIRDDALIVDKLIQIRTLTGGVLAPFNAWMISRGIQTLHCRMERHCANALIIAKMLEGRDEVERVRYPFLPSSPDYELARKQMSGGGGMVSFEVRGGRDAAIKVASKLSLFVNATSLGGVESLIEHRASVEGEGTTTPQNLLRMSIGLENPQDLVADLVQALSAL